MFELSKEELYKELLSHHTKDRCDIKIDLDDVDLFLHKDKKIYRVVSRSPSVFLSSNVKSISVDVEDILMCFFIHPNYFDYGKFHRYLNEVYQLFGDHEHSLFSISFDENIKANECLITIYITTSDSRKYANNIIRCMT